MKRFIAGLLFLIILGNCQNYSRLPKVEKKASYLSDKMNFEQIEQAMKAFPPSFEFGDQRLNIMESLDALINFSLRSDDYKRNYNVPKDLPEYVQPLNDIVKFYLKQVDLGLDALEKTKVKKGVHVFKFYSSSVVLKSANGSVAIDFAQGPAGSGNEPPFSEPEESDPYECGFYMTPEQRDRLAQIIDVQIITHRHFDHADYSLAKRLLKMGKTVIAPAQLKNSWKDLSSYITVPNYGTAEKFGPVEIFTQLGYQFANNICFTDPSMDNESVLYILKLGGISFLQAAENHTEAYDWLTKAASQGWNVNVVFSPGNGRGGSSVLNYLKDKHIQYFKIPVHEYEITHKGGGIRAAPLLKGENRKAFDQRKSMPLLWGEDFHITKSLLQY